LVGAGNVSEEDPVVRRVGRPRKRGPWNKKPKRNLPRLPRTKTKIRKDVGPFIRKARNALRLTLDALGASVGVQGRAIMRWENGRNAPTRRNFEAVVAHFRTIRPDVATWLWGEATGEKAPEPPPPSIPVLRTAILEMSDALDVSPRKAREALRRLLAKISAERFSLTALVEAVEAWSAETTDG
jgi:transcriptional regulator with XRE-family HTH domain